MQADKFKIEHIHPIHGSKEKANSISYSFENSSGIGIVVVVKCLVCEVKLDVTDIDYW